MFDIEFIKKHANQTWACFRQIDWHLKQIILHCDMSVGPIYGQRQLTNDQRAIALGFLSEIQKYKFPTVTPRVMNTSIETLDPLIYLTAHALPAVIEHYQKALITKKDNETLAEFEIVSYKTIGEMAVEIAQAALDKINQNNQNNQDKLKNIYSGSTNGWSWSIHPWDFNALDNSVWPETTWYVDIHGKEQSLTADEFNNPREALSTISMFCAFHPKGQINPSHPIRPFQFYPPEH